MERRQFLKVLGGGTVIAALGASGTFLATRTPTRALRPWTIAGIGYDDPRRHALSYAILAPNPHNRQPWLVDLSVPDRIRVQIDPERLLPDTDPFSRQIIIGLGCFLELLRMAAAETGHRADLAPFPHGYPADRIGSEPVADIRLVADPAITPDPLFAHALARRSNRDSYDVTRPVPATALAAIERVGGPGTRIATTAEPEERAALRSLTRDAFEVEMRTPQTYRESAELFRIGRAEIEANPDGIVFSGVRFELLHRAGLFTREAALDMNSPFFEQGLAGILETIDTAMAFVWLTTAGNSRTDQLNAGRDWLRINLQTTAAGLATQPLSQPLQEYAEMADHYARVHRELAPEGGTVQMLARLGYGTAIDPSPRWALETRIVDS